MDMLIVSLWKRIDATRSACDFKSAQRMNRFETDYLCASSSFLAGVGSVVCLAGNLDYNTSDNPDRDAIAQDWLMVGQDIRDVMGGG